MKSIDQLQESGSYAGRSELVRASIRLLLDDNKTKASMIGSQITALLVITHGRLDDEPITRLKHEYEDIVKTHIHNQIGPNTCAELLLVQGAGRRVSLMARAFQKEDNVDSVKLVVI